MGSPPRMRGKHESDWKGLINARITPADAGKTRAAVHTDNKYQDHPRGCGENE